MCRLFISFTLLVFVACSAREQQYYNAASLHLEMKAGLMMNNDEPFTGIALTLDPLSGDTLEQVAYQDGMEHGEWRKFYPGGELMEQRFFLHGKKQGNYTAWWPNRQMRLLYHFTDGEYQGTCREWNDKGKQVKEMNYQAGHESGSQKVFYDDGKIKANYVLLNGRRYGLLGTKNCKNVSDSIFK